MSSGAKRRFVVVGGVAAGMSAASQAKRRDPELEVIVFEKGDWVSYGACGMPYNIEDPQREIEDLVVMSADRFRKERGIDVRTAHEVLDLDTRSRTVRVRHPGGEQEFEWDNLLLATGCRAVHPDWSGMDLDGIFELHTLPQAAAIKNYLKDSSLRRAVVIGGGHIGLEMTDVLAARGLEVSLLTRSGILPSGYSPEISAVVTAELEKHGVRVESGVSVSGFAGQHRVQRVLTESGEHEADMVLVATGVVPQVGLAKRAGISLGASGAIGVDRQMQTSAPGVFAAGDCAEAEHILLKRGQFIPRGTTANKQGKVAGANVVGAGESFGGVVGTSVTKVFSQAVGHTGLLDHQADQAGFQTASTLIRGKTRAHSYPGAKDLSVRLLFERKGGRLLGAQLAGGEGVAKRIDILVAALYAGWTVDQISDLDLSYAPPFAPVWDPILVAANIARKKVE